MKMRFICWLLAGFLLPAVGELFAQPRTGSPALQKTYLQALRSIGKGEYVKARRALRSLIRQDSTFFRAYLKMADLHKYEHSLDAARRFFEAEIAEQPQNPVPYHALGRVLKWQRSFQAALDTLIRALRLNPKYGPAYPDLVDCYARLQDAEKAIKEVVRAMPDNAAAHYGLAYLYGRQFRYAEQLQEAQKALELDPDMLDARSLLIDAYYWLGKYQDAARECEVGLQMAARQMDVEKQADFLASRAFADYKLGRFSQAVEKLKQVRRWRREFGDRDGEVTTLIDLARIHWYSARYRRAIGFALRAREKADSLRDANSSASAWNYAAICAAELGDLSRALDYFNRAREIWEKLKQPGSVAICLGNIAAVYTRLGMLEQGIDTYGRAIAMLEGLGPGWNKPRANYLVGMGTAFRQMGNLEEALKRYEGALALLQNMKTEAHQVCTVLGNIGEVHQLRGEDSLALAYYRRAEAMQPAIFSQQTHMQIALRIGNFYLKNGDFRRAEAYFRRVLQAGRKNEEPQQIWRAAAGLGATYARQRRYQQARGMYETAVQAIEKMHGRLRSEKEKAGFERNKAEVYAGLIGVLAQLQRAAPDSGYDATAFHYAERSRAQALLGIIDEARIFQNLEEVPESFRERYTANVNALEKKQTELARVLAAKDSAGARREAMALRFDIERLQREKAQLAEEIRRRFPRLHRLTHPEILTVRQVQNRILGSNQALLEYLIGEEQSFVWMLTRNALHFHTIPMGRKELAERLAAVSALFSGISARSDAPLDHRWANIQPNPLHRLYQLLMAPLADRLPPGTELIIVPDDLLHYLPFEMLVAGFENGRPRYLVQSYPISYAPSASLQALPRSPKRRAPRELLAFGNPDFGREQGRGVVAWVESLVPFKSIFRGERFVPLPFAEREVRAAAANFSRADVFTGRRASESNFKALAGQYRFLHLATHNLTDDHEPMYSKIIFSQRDTGRDDGFLQTYEVYNLRLNAELVVLSGCNTGLGKFSRGEGLLGMTRAFFYAGASSLLVSLWPVNDASTAELMQHFYQNLKKGMSRRRALQQAKLVLLNSPDWRANPFYWAAFILLGDGGPVAME